MSLFYSKTWMYLRMNLRKRLCRYLKQNSIHYQKNNKCKWCKNNNNKCNITMSMAINKSMMMKRRSQALLLPLDKIKRRQLRMPNFLRIELLCLNLKKRKLGRKSRRPKEKQIKLPKWELVTTRIAEEKMKLECRGNRMRRSVCNKIWLWKKWIDKP